MCISNNQQQSSGSVFINKYSSNRINWSKTTKEHIYEYKVVSWQLLADIKVKKELLHCNDLNCKSTECRESINDI